MKILSKSLLIQLAIYIPAEIFLYLSYSLDRSSFHWATHFFVGNIVVFVGFSIWEYVTHRPVGLPFVWLLGGHLFAMAPDLLFRYAHIAHERWMDIFFGHITTHFIPGQNWTWYVLFMITFGMYLLLGRPQSSNNI